MEDFRTYYDNYKSIVAAQPDFIPDLRKNVKQIVEQKQLIPLMNDLKWLKLQYGIKKDFTFSPAYLVKCVTDETEPDIRNFRKNVPRYHGVWSNYYEEGMPVLFTIQWLEAYPKFERFQGRLIEGKVIDESEKFKQLLVELRIPFEQIGDTFRIYGYKNKGT
ncbi:hypothetical protein JZO70_11225 [Enterococcus sp. 669A]|uniref:Uncharacterized protein n=1 Tax=Candidatus Enterococcus moelleringii TaxID=2815325 RepID=A0ABS3LAU3_9ENTE|nr:DUF6678 family protein [Enterococcus sp. 669A]MBO1306737.1 hypothetical protein [Enterococcus sp. 669A]